MLPVLPLADAADTFVISDFHAGHGLLPVVRGVGAQTADEHDRIKTERWNAAVGPNSTGFHLGDLAMRDPEGEKTRRLLDRLNFGRLYLLWGNHNSGAEALYRRGVSERLREWGAVGADLTAGPEAPHLYPLAIDLGARTVVFLGDLAAIEFEVPSGRQRAVLCHYALATWPGNHKGYWMLCGHTHGHDPATHRQTGKTRALDCSFESIERPLSLVEIDALLRRRPVPTHRHAPDEA